MRTKEKVTRAEAKKHLVQFYLSCELLKVIRRFLQAVVPLFSIFYINSMQKTSEEFNFSGKSPHLRSST